MELRVDKFDESTRETTFFVFVKVCLIIFAWTCVVSVVHSFEEILTFRSRGILAPDS
jgi:hypothetical protein